MAEARQRYEAARKRVAEELANGTDHKSLDPMLLELSRQPPSEESVKFETAMRAQYAAQERAKRAMGRYALDEALDAIAADESIDRGSLKSRMLASMDNGSLPIYAPGQRNRIDVTDSTPDEEARKRNRRRRYRYSLGLSIGEEIKWCDLNAWLEENEPGIGFRFRAPEARVTTAQHRDVSAADATDDSETTDRGDILWPLINKAKEHAQDATTSAVFTALRDLAVKKTSPFTGDISKTGELMYVDASNNLTKLSKRALHNRLRRKQQRSAADRVRK